MTQPLKSLVIYSEFYPPHGGATSQLIHDLHTELSKSTTRVFLISLSTSDITLTFIPSWIHLQFNSIYCRLNSKGLKAIVFSLYALLTTFFLPPNSNLLIVSNPPFLGLVGLISKIVRRSRYIFLLQDLFPSTAKLAGILPASGPLLLFWVHIMRLICSCSDLTLVLSPNMVKRFKSDFPGIDNVDHINNWAVEFSQHSNSSSNPYTRRWNTDSKLTIQYSGNFGLLHDMFTMLESSRLLQDYPIQFVFVGNGPKRYQIQTFINKLKLANVTLHPYVPRADLTYSLAACDLSAITLVPGADDLVSPSKLLGILASRRPILLIGSKNSYIGHLINSYDIGYQAEPGDVLSVVRIIKHILNNRQELQKKSDNAFELYNQLFTKARAIKKYHSLLN